MKFTLKQLNEVWPSVEKLMQSKLDVVVSFRIKGFSKAITVEMRDFIEARDKLIKQYGKPVEGTRFQVITENAIAYGAAIDDLLKQETDEIPSAKLTLEEVKNSELTVGDIANLDFLFE